MSVPVSHTINNWCPVRIPVLAGFVVLCGANIVGNIISAEKICNYPGRSRVTRLVVALYFSSNWLVSIRCNVTGIVLYVSFDY